MGFIRHSLWHEHPSPFRVRELDSKSQIAALVARLVDMTDSREQPLSFDLPVRFYARGCVAWDDENPARGFRGLTTRPLLLTTANTVIACMHPGNYCYPGGVEWGPDSPHAWWTGKMANLPRIRTIIDERITPLLEAARAAGMRVLYLLQGWRNAMRYPQYRELLERVPEPDTSAIPRSPNLAWRQERDADIYGPDWRTPERNEKLAQVLDVAPPIEPRPSDWVAATTAQASTLLSENGVWNILYTGFDTNGCVWLSEGGMHKMGKLGYRCILLRDCTLGGETAETFPESEMTESFIRLVELGSYTASSLDLRRELGAAGRPKRESARN